ncbi:hypothetical protein EXIGLDRAFT_775480 [Exidia glandulosa HHB12029]|uniref:Uncharacterized protein n=1 Tax=Exidia glandulosa HHB12029 TaxID=1314781 RepID=A0A165DWN5_EXIGL|nr:hypothetical protein EXIGLDRAFT_775480 [Exidia glandulosa HHB12029]
MAVVQDAWPSRMRQDTQRAPSRSRALTVPYYQDIEDNDDENSEAEEDGSDDKDGGLLQMLSMLSEIKKKKAAKLSSAYLQQKKARFKDARADAKELKSAGTAYIRQCVEAANAMGKDDTQPDDLIRAMNDLFVQAAQHDLTKHADGFMEDLSTRRVANVAETADVVTNFNGRRTHLRRQLKRKAKLDYEQQIEQAQIATNARELIKGYKKLISAGTRSSEQ